MNPVETSELFVLSVCLEWFLHGKISVLCPLICMLLKKVQLFPGLGIYSAIFIIYLHCVLSKESRTTGIVFYALCLLYILSTAAVVSNLLGNVIQVSNNSISKYIIFFISYTAASQNTTGSESTSSYWFTVIVISYCDCRSHSIRLLWLQRPIYIGTHKHLYLSFVLFT